MSERNDPAVRMRRLVKQWKQQALVERAQNLWCRRVRGLAREIESIIETFRAAVDADQPMVRVLADPQRPDYALVIAFDRRGPAADIVSLRSSSMPQIGASCIFRCDDQGMICGTRYPFHDVQQDVRAERFADLGPPEAVDATRLGHAVVDFLEWASVGSGTGTQPIRFGQTERCAPEAGGRTALRVVAA